jgi:hypothetical protein
MIKLLMQASLAIFIISAAIAQPKDGLPGRSDLTTLNCKSVFEMDPTNTAIVLAWLQRHFLPRDAAPIIEMEKLRTDGLKLREYCGANPSKTVMEAAGELFGLRL